MKILLSLFLISFCVSAKVEPIEEIFEPDPSLYSPLRYGKVAVVQWAPTESAPLTDSKEVAEAFKMKNRQKLEEYIREATAKGAELVITPEFGTVGYPDIPDLPSEDDNFRNRDDIRPYVETVPGNTTSYFTKLAKELGVTIHVGLAEVDAKTDQYYNTVVVINYRGEMIAKYRKIHLFKVEKDYLSAGTDTVVYESQFGKIGMIICSDIYSDYPMNAYRDMQLDVMVLSTSWAHYNTGWEHFIKGALWTKTYLLAANQDYFPDSGVINPDGSFQSHIRQTTGIAYGYLPYHWF